MFSPDGLLYGIFTTIYKYLTLNLLFLVFSIPVVTIPAASTALFAVVRKHVNHEEPALIRSFWQGFRDNWRQASIVGFLFFLIGCMWWEDIRMLTKSHIPFDSLLSFVMLVLGIILASVLIHLFPLMVHVHSNIKQLFISALKLTMIKPHLTLLNLIIIVGLFFLSIRFTILFVACFFSLSAMLTYRLVNRKFEHIGAVSQKTTPCR